MSARAAAQGILQRLVNAAPAAWRHDPIFRGAAIGAGVTLLVLLLRVTGPQGPALDATAPRPSNALSPAAVQIPSSRAVQPSEAAGNVPSIAPGQPLSDALAAPTPSTDRFGTIKPGTQP